MNLAEISHSNTKHNFLIVFRTMVPYFFFKEIHDLCVCFFQLNSHPIKSKYRLYSPSAMTAAFRRVREDGMFFLKASRVYSVPETTLRDRVLLIIDPETCVKKLLLKTLV